MKTRYTTVRRRKRDRAGLAEAIWGTLAGASFLLLLGIAGGVEQGSIALGTGVWMMAAAMGTWVMFSWLAGWFL